MVKVEKNISQAHFSCSSPFLVPSYQNVLATNNSQ